MGSMPIVWRGDCPLGQFCSKKSAQIAKRKDRAKVVKSVANHLYGSTYHEEIDKRKKAEELADDEAFIIEGEDEEENEAEETAEAADGSAGKAWCAAWPTPP